MSHNLPPALQDKFHCCLGEGQMILSLSCQEPHHSIKCHPTNKISIGLFPLRSTLPIRSLRFKVGPIYQDVKRMGNPLVKERIGCFLVLEKEASFLYFQISHKEWAMIALRFQPRVCAILWAFIKPQAKMPQKKTGRSHLMGQRCQT